MGMKLEVLQSNSFLFLSTNQLIYIIFIYLFIYFKNEVILRLWAYPDYLTKLF